MTVQDADTLKLFRFLTALQQDYLLRNDVKSTVKRLLVALLASTGGSQAILCEISHDTPLPTLQPLVCCKASPEQWASLDGVTSLPFEAFPPPDARTSQELTHLTHAMTPLFQSLLTSHKMIFLYQPPTLSSKSSTITPPFSLDLPIPPADAVVHYPCVGFPLLVDGQVTGCIGLQVPHIHNEDAFSASTFPLWQAASAIFTHHLKRKRSEERHHQSQRLESLGRLAGGIAHDVNNLLMGVITEASFLQDSVPSTSPLRDGFDRILASAQQIRTLARQLLSYAGRRRLDIEAISPDEMIRDIQSILLRLIPKETRLSITLQTPHVLILADTSQLQQVVVNLVLNAVESIDHDEGLIHLRSRVVGIPSLPATSYPAPQGWWELCVEDNGVGIPEEIKKRLFEPFFTTKKQGRGLGLAIVSGIVHRLNGNILCQDNPPKGTRFLIRLPIHPPDIAIPPPPLSPLPKSALSAKRRVLIADDEDMVRELLLRILQHQGCQVTATRDGQEAIDCFRNAPQDFDLVLLDVSMPRCNGYEALREIRAIQPETPVVLVSGFSEGTFGGTWQDALHAQPNAFLEKPFKAQALIQLIQEFFPSDPKDAI